VTHPREGEPAPAFDLPATGGRNYSLEEFRGRGVLLAFYPGDFTAVCTRQFCSYRDESERLAELGVQMLGISPQSVHSHERFTRKYNLTVPLLADEDKSVSGAYGVLGPGGFVRRAVFVIDGELMIRYRNVKKIGLTYESAADLERAVAALL
jgi:peroxiredoxin